jgi:hypothetical protein
MPIYDDADDERHYELTMSATRHFADDERAPLMIRRCATPLYAPIRAAAIAAD